jgi:hypothetical protein
MRDNTGTPAISEIQTQNWGQIPPQKRVPDFVKRESSVLISAHMGAFVSKLRWGPRA